jgi:hypothetical protein
MMWSALTVREKVDWARKNMGQFMAIAAKLIPQDVKHLVESVQPVGLDATDIEILRAIRAEIPDADSKSPAEVFAYVQDAIRSHSAKVIEALNDPAPRN